MKILLLAPHPFFIHRGTPIAVRSLVRVLTGTGHRVTLLTYHQGDDVESPGLELRRIPRAVGGPEIPPGFSLRKLVCDAVMVFSCVRLMRRERFDLVHAVEEGSFIALAMKGLFGVPYVYDMDSSLAQQMMERFPVLRGVRVLLEFCEGLAIRHSTAVLAVCQSLVDTARRHAPGQFVAKLEDVSLLTGAETAGERLSEQIGSNGPIVMYVGNLEHYQGIDLLVDAFAQALPSVPEARLVVIGGSPPQIERYRERCRGLGLADHAHFVGPRPVDRLGHYLRQAEVVVSPRIQGANTAMKVYSYLDSGRPLLATRLLTHTQVLDDEISLLVRPEPGEMAAGLVRLLREPELRRRLVEQASERVQREFSPEAFRRKLTRFYAEIAERVADPQSQPSSR
jgi:glycosyltransferase involved in cell wall biosynthesis